MLKNEFDETINRLSVLRYSDRVLHQQKLLEEYFLPLRTFDVTSLKKSVETILATTEEFPTIHRLVEETKKNSVKPLNKRDCSQCDRGMVRFESEGFVYAARCTCNDGTRYSPEIPLFRNFSEKYQMEYNFKDRLWRRKADMISQEGA